MQRSNSDDEYSSSPKPRNESARISEAEGFDEFKTLEHLANPTSTYEQTRLQDSIGPYGIVKKIAAGGMGVVYVAEQFEPIHRLVALKVIKSGCDSAQIVSRFDAERQALAMMEHQNIAKILDAGQTSEGVPYFVMELVAGIPIQEYCDKNRLSVKDRLELFIPVCRAVQHAHQKGVIHRDLKPSNVLVAEQDGKPIPKVIDFGLAKALDHQSRLSGTPMNTEFGMVVGTVQYMSPEQAELDSKNVDARTDIYSLGVMLYELLTGSTPLEKSQLKHRSLLQILELIREEDPPSPSSRLTQSSDSLTSISGERKIEPSKLKQILRGDLDWVVMKALSKDPRRRYESASELASDILNYLNMDPVSARPPSRTYRVGKFYQKNRASVIAASFVVLSLIVGIFATSIASYLAYQESKRANQLAFQKTQETTRAKTAELDALEKEEIARAQSQVTVETLQKLVVGLESSLKDIPGTSKLREIILQTVFDNLSNVATSYVAQEEVDFNSAMTLVQLGDLVRDYGQQEGDNLGPKKELTQTQQSGLRLAETFYRKANEVFERLDVSSSGLELTGHLIGVEIDLASTVEKLGQVKEAELLYLSALSRARQVENPSVSLCLDLATIYERLGDLNFDLGNMNQVRHYFELRFDITSGLVSSEPDNRQFKEWLAKSHDILAFYYLRNGDNQSAAGHVRENLKILNELDDGSEISSNLMLNLANAYRLEAKLKVQDGRAEESIASLNKSIEIQTRLSNLNKGDLNALRILASYYENLAGELRGLGKTRAGIEAIQSGIEVLKGLVEKDDANADFHRLLGMSYIIRGDLHHQAEDDEAAIQSYRKTQKIFSVLRTKEPKNITLLRDKCVLNTKIGTIYEAEGEFEKARNAYEEGYQILHQIHEIDPEDQQNLTDRSYVVELLASVAKELKDFEASEIYYRKSLAYSESYLELNPDNAEAKVNIPISHETLGSLFQEMKQADKALKEFETAEKMLLEFLEEYPGDTWARVHLAQTLGNLGIVHRQLGKLESAIKYLRKGNAIMEELVAAETWVNFCEERIQNATEEIDFISNELKPAIGPLDKILAEPLEQRANLLDTRMDYYCYDSNKRNHKKAIEAATLQLGLKHTEPDLIVFAVKAIGDCLEELKDEDGIDQFKRLAVEGLKKAISLGWKPDPNLSDNKSLKSLRGFGPFEELIDE